MKDTPIILADDVDLSFMHDVKPVAMRKGQKRTENRPEKWIDLITAFDIETTRIDIKIGLKRIEHHSIMYIWQWQIDEYVTVIGRTWDEFIRFYERMNKVLEKMGFDCVVYVHNLSYEFQFLWEILDLANTAKIFATSLRDVLYFKRDHFTFRCSERLSNDSLRHWCETLKTDHQKLGMDYSVKRYPWTELPDDVIAYSVTDVVCLVEAVKKQMSMHGDTLYSIPYTATGYIRRILKREMWFYRTAIQEQTNDLSIYRLLRLAFRGGNTHASNALAGIPLEEVESWDRSSSYPDILVNEKFPVTRFKEEPPDIKAFNACIKSKRACLVKIRYWDLHTKPGITCPYICYSSCSKFGLIKPYDATCDNGRIIGCKFAEMVLTDVDYQIIESTYTWSKMQIVELYSARYGYLPKPIRDICIDLYRRKTALKGVESDEIEYMRMKNLLNSIYGCMVQRAISPEVYINEDGHWDYKPGYDEAVEYSKYVEKTFLNYSWGVWCCAIARLRLEEGINICGQREFIYCDTDSVKCLGHPDFSDYNAKRIKASKASGAYATDIDGNSHYMGVFEHEYTAKQFVTLGAKRYAATYPNKKSGLDELHLTISGVDKEKGAEELTIKGGIEVFQDGIVFENSGHIAAFHNDHPGKTITIDGHEVKLTSNVCLIETPYTLKIEKEYKGILQKIALNYARQAEKDLPFMKFSLEYQEEMDYTVFA